MPVRFGEKRSAAAPCPCASGRAYGDCCAPLHRGAREAETPTDLMRSRFAAFAVGDAEYLWRTLHRDHEDRERPKDEAVRAITEACRTLRFQRLTILDSRDDEVL